MQFTYFYCLLCLSLTYTYNVIIVVCTNLHVFTQACVIYP